MSFPAVNANVFWVSAALFAVLTAGTAVRLSGRRAPREVRQRQSDSLKTWWVLAVLVVVSALGGLPAALVLFTLVSVLGLREFLQLVPAARLDRLSVAAAFLLIPAHYLLIGFRNLSLVGAFLPLASVMLLSTRMVYLGRTGDYVRALASLQWGLLMTAYFVAHAPLLFALPETTNPVAGGAGWFLFLLILIEGNDIAQALIGRRFGKRKLAPRVSPRKTWEGFVGGLATTAVTAALLAPWLTPFSPGRAISAGLLISCSGLLGDLNMSAVKREAGAGDSGTLLPGQGGILDRTDSLMFAAPAFFYFVLLV